MNTTRTTKTILLIVLVVLLATGAEATLTDSIVAYWNLDYNVASPVDSVNGYYNFSKKGTPPYQNPAKINAGYNMSEANKLVMSKMNFDNTVINGSSDICIGFWAQFTTTLDSSQYHWMFIFRNAASQYPFGVLSGSPPQTRIQLVQNDGTSSFSSSVYFKGIGNYSHYVFCRDYTNSRYYAYHNATIFLNESFTRRTPTGSMALEFWGNANASGMNAAGKIDEVGVWNRILNSTEITQFYQYGIDGIQYPFTPTSSNNTWQVNVTDLFNNSAFQGVNVTFYNASGVLASVLTDVAGEAEYSNEHPQTISWMANFSGYYNASGTVDTNDSAEANLYEAVFNITSVTAKVSGASVSTAYNCTTTGGKTYSNCLNVYLTNATNTVTWKKSGYYDYDTSVSASAYEFGTFSITNVHNNQYNITAVNMTGGTISNFTVNVSSDDYPSFSESLTTTSGKVTFNLTQGINYTFIIDATDFALGNATLTANASSQTKQFTLYTTNSINFSFYDEESNALLNGTLIVIELISDAMSLNTTTLTGSTYIDLLTPSTYTIRYTGTGYDSRFYELTVVDRYHYAVNLTLLNSSSATDVTITVYDTLGNKLEGAKVKIQKYDIVTNSYILNQVVTTNFEGIGQASLQQNSEYYKFIIEYDGVVVFTSNPTYIYGTTLTFYVTLGSLGFDEYFEAQALSGQLKASYTTHQTQFTFNDEDNLATQGCAYAYTVDTNGLTLFNSSCAASPSGTVYVGVTNTSGANYLIKGVMTKNGETYTISSLAVDYDSTLPGEGGLGLLLLLFVETVIIFIGTQKMEIGIVLGGLAPLLFTVMGLITIGYAVTAPLFVISIITAYIIGVKKA